VRKNNMDEKEKQFCDKLASILETKEVKFEDILKNFELWDSLTVLSIIIMIDSEYGVTVYAKEIMELKTVQDLYLFVQKKRQTIKETNKGKQ